MIRIIRLTLCLLSLSVISGCYRIRYHLESSNEDVKNRVVYRTESWNNYFIFGLIPVHESYQLDTLCGHDRILEVQSVQKPANVLSSLLGAGLTSASTLEALCVAGKK